MMQPLKKLCDLRHQFRTSLVLLKAYGFASLLAIEYALSNETDLALG